MNPHDPRNYPRETYQQVKPRHPSVAHVLQFFEFGQLPSDLQIPSMVCRDLAFEMANNLPENPELTKGLDHLLKAKDCFVRALVAEKNAEAQRALDLRAPHEERKP